MASAGDDVVVCVRLLWYVVSGDDVFVGGKFVRYRAGVG